MRDETLSHKKKTADPPKQVTEPFARQNPFEGLLLREKLTQPVSLTEDHIRSVLLVRRARRDILGDNLFSDPAWDILLELYAAKLGGRQMSIAEVARAIETPASTTKRWVAALEERGLIASSIEPAAQDVWIALTDEAADKVGRLADHWGSAFVSI